MRGLTFNSAATSGTFRSCGRLGDVTELLLAACDGTLAAAFTVCRVRALGPTAVGHEPLDGNGCLETGVRCTDAESGSCTLTSR